MEIDEFAWWSEVVDRLEGWDAVPAAQANGRLLRCVQDRWRGRVVPRTSMHDLLFTLLDDSYPFGRTLRVVSAEGEYTFRLRDHNNELSVEQAAGLDHATQVLDRLLVELTTTTT